MNYYTDIIIGILCGGFLLTQYIVIIYNSNLLYCKSLATHNLVFFIQMMQYAIKIAINYWHIDYKLQLYMLYNKDYTELQCKHYNATAIFE